MADWHCTVSGTKYGPVSLEQLRQWIAEGRVTAADLVWTEGMASWQPAAGVPELGGVGPAPTATPGPVPGAAYPQPYYGAALPNAPGAVSSMVCGIVGVVIWCAGLVLGIIAIVQSRKAKEVIRTNPGRYGGEGMATAGLVLGIIALVVGVIGIIWFVGFATAMNAGFHSTRYRTY